LKQNASGTVRTDLITMTVGFIAKYSIYFSECSVNTYPGTLRYATLWYHCYYVSSWNTIFLSMKCLI